VSSGGTLRGGKEDATGELPVSRQNRLIIISNPAALTKCRSRVESECTPEALKAILSATGKVVG